MVSLCACLAPGTAAPRVVTSGFEHQSNPSNHHCELRRERLSLFLRRGPSHPRWGVSGTRRLDHRHDAGLDRLGKIGPCIHHGGQVGVGRDIGLTQMGSRLGSSRGAD